MNRQTLRRQSSSFHSEGPLVIRRGKKCNKTSRQGRRGSEDSLSLVLCSLYNHFQPCRTANTSLEWWCFTHAHGTQVNSNRRWQALETCTHFVLTYRSYWIIRRRASLDIHYQSTSFSHEMFHLLAAVERLMKTSAVAMYKKPLRGSELLTSI